MKRRSFLSALTVAPIAASLAACSDQGGAGTPGASGAPGGSGAPAGGELTLAGWSLSTTPEFKVLADGFNATNPAYKVTLKEYDATNYDTQMIADLSAGTAPDLYVQKNLKNFVTYSSGDQLVDVSDLAKDLSSVEAVKMYTTGGKTFAIPYRQDAWFLFYNKDLFTLAGVPTPTGTWTWDDYAKAADALTAGLKGKKEGATGTYQHNWQSTVQGFASAQVSGADILSNNFAYFKPYYERSLALQKSGAMPTYGTVTTNKLTYQAQFGTQKAAMMLMGSWYIATLIAQQKGGQAEKFTWGVVAAPQVDAAATAKPTTFGDPTGIGINPKVAKDKLATAKAFLKYIASPAAAKALAGIGISPAFVDDSVSAALFAAEGAPKDDLSKKAFSNRTVKPENPVDKRTAPLQNVLNDMHSSIMSESATVDAAITKAQDRAKSEVK